MPPMQRFLLIICACLAVALAGCGSGSSTTSSSEEATAPKEKEAATKTKTKPKVAVPNGAPPKKLEVKDLEAGTGAVAKAGDAVTVNYVGVNYKTGKEFDASWDRGEPFTSRSAPAK
jgi:FKBP-type peptidyl-prolyl cis-trans isomerase